MPSFDPTRYRAVHFVGGRILQARELDQMQELARGVDANNIPTAFGLDAIYRSGATFNISVGIVGQTVTLTPTVLGIPMLVFIRQQWEQLAPSEALPVSLDPNLNQTQLYLNWQIVQVTSATDPSLVDVTSGEPTADMGQLVMSVSALDDSLRTLAGNEFEKNTSPVVLFNFAFALDNTMSRVATDNAQSQALGTLGSSGVVKLTTSTSSGTAVASDDPAITAARTPSDDSVRDIKVHTPTAVGGLNVDGTPAYSLVTDGGGISAAKIILQASTQLLSDAWLWLKSGYLALLALYNAHQGAVLGQGNTHPFPTAAQVSAAPSSHVGQPLGLSGSHPATTSTSQGGFRVLRDPAVPATPGDAAFGTTESTTLKNGLMHNGDIFSLLANALIASPLHEGGDPTLGSGPLGNMSLIARVLAEHVNKTSHKNPHGISLDDLGGSLLATIAYVDTQDAGTLQSANNNTAIQVPHLSISTQAVTGTGVAGTYLILNFSPNNNQAHKVAFGMGTAIVYPSAAVIPLPTASGAFISTQAILQVALQRLPGYGNNSLISSATCNVVSGLTVNGSNVRYGDTGNLNDPTNETLAWFCICWT